MVSLRSTGIAALVVSVGVGLGFQPAVARAVPVSLSVSNTEDGRQVRQSLTGAVWHDTGAPLSTLAPLQIHSVRIDADLDELSPAAGQLNLRPLLDRIAAVRAVGGEPLLIVSYMPKWLSACTLPGAEPAHCKPAELDQWGRLVNEVVTAAATAPDGGARRFEAWNEPDLPVSWIDTPWSWLDVAARTGREVLAVERATGIDLEYGGPASFFPDPVNIATFLDRMYAEAVPVDFISWHWYANTPFLGPDGNEFPAAAALYPFLGHRNPLLTPASYGVQIQAIRSLVRDKADRAGRPVPELFIDEWNMSAGGFDNRNDTNEGAAFAAATLIEMQNADLDEAMIYRATDKESGQTGDWGLTTVTGTKKPVWASLHFWQQLAPQQLRITGSDPANGLWAIASRDDHRTTVLVAAFSQNTPTSRTLHLALPEQLTGKKAIVQTITATDPSGSERQTSVTDGYIDLDLAAQSTTLIEIPN